MADFAQWVSACEGALWKRGAFLAAYTGNIEEAVETVLENDQVATVLRSYIDLKAEFGGSASELLKALNQVVPESQQKAKSWPKRPNTLSGILRRIAPPLRKIGIDVVFDRDPDKQRARKIVITRRSVRVGETSSGSSASSGTGDINDLQRTIPDRGSSAIGEGIVSDDGADGLSDDPNDEIVRCNPLKNRTSDDPDDADDPLHNFTGSHVCAQCHGPPDGKERPVAYGDETIWLHAECERFFIKAKMQEQGIRW